MSAYAVVGPTNTKPRRFSSLAIAIDSELVAGTSARVAGRGRGPEGANDHSSVDRPSGSRCAARALAIDAVIFARFRTMPASVIRRAWSSSEKAATASIAKPANADRNAGRL